MFIYFFFCGYGGGRKERGRKGGRGGGGGGGGGKRAREKSKNDNLGILLLNKNVFMVDLGKVRGNKSGVNPKRSINTQKPRYLSTLNLLMEFLNLPKFFRKYSKY